jgi:hypothetical protein
MIVGDEEMVKREVDSGEGMRDGGSVNDGERSHTQE